MIKVGAATETEMKEKKARVEDAMHATKAAVEEGIVPGRRRRPAARHQGGRGGQGRGRRPRRRQHRPSRARGAGPSDRQQRRRGGLGHRARDHRAQTGNIGFNAATGEYEDLVKAGVIDPAKVTKTALINAASIAGLMLTTEALISEIKEKDEKGGGGMPGGGGMGGMY